MFEEISYFEVFGIPLIAYGGVFTLFSFPVYSLYCSLKWEGGK